MIAEGEEEKLNEILAKCAVEQINQYEVPLRRAKRDNPASGGDKAAEGAFGDSEFVIWFKDFPSNAAQLQAL